MARLFVALWPPEHVVEELTALPRKDTRGVRFVPPENWHVTLRFLGEADPGQAEEALDGALLPATVARLGPAVDVLGRHNLVVPVGGLDELAAAVTRPTATIGEPPRAPFNGHLTIARAKRGARMPPALGMIVSARWQVPEVALVLSRLRPDGARYETLTRWPVIDPEAG